MPAPAKAQRSASRAQVENCYTASDKAIAIGGGVWHASLEYTGVLRGGAGRNAREV